MKLKECFEIRAVQLDLARQMETLDFIKEFIDLIAENKYNTLVLYLEGRVRTKTFNFPSEYESYSPAEMREVVEYAAAKDIDVIPFTQALGHAELFLSYPEMEPLSELRDSEDMIGRWSIPAARHDTFCPSLSDTRKFLENYFTELAEIFPTKYFSAGLDESWHMGVCEKCRNCPEGQDGIFTEFIIWLHTLITGKLGKRMMLWDDMFQHYPHALKNIPKDIILCCWHYDSPMKEIRWQFGGNPRADKLKEFSDMGFDCLICPADFTLNNIETFTEYASIRPCMGGLLTMWEKGSIFYHQSLPLVAYAGRLWNGGEAEQAFTEAVKSVCGLSDLMFVQIMKMAKNISIREWRSDVDCEMMLRGTPTHDFTFTAQAAVTITMLLKQYLEKMPESRNKLILQNLIMFFQYGSAHEELRALVPKFYQSNQAPHENDRTALIQLIHRFEEIRDANLSFWKTVRPGLQPDKLENFWTSLLNNLYNLLKKEKTGIITLLLYSHFGSYGIQETAVDIQFEGDSKWYNIVDNRLTPYFAETMVERKFCFPLDKIPVALRIETYGYGRQGFRYVEIENACGRFIPDSITDVKGKVIEPENILCDDNWSAFAGEKYKRNNFNNLDSQANRKRHGIEISLKKL